MMEVMTGYERIDEMRLEGTPRRGKTRMMRWWMRPACDYNDDIHQMRNGGVDWSKER